MVSGQLAILWSAQSAREDKKSFAMDVLTGQPGSPRVTGLKRTLSLGETCPIFHSSVDVMVQGHTKPPRLGPSNISATGMSPA